MPCDVACCKLQSVAVHSVQYGYACTNTGRAPEVQYSNWIASLTMAPSLITRPLLLFSIWAAFIHGVPSTCLLQAPPQRSPTWPAPLKVAPDSERQTTCTPTPPQHTILYARHFLVTLYSFLLRILRQQHHGPQTRGEGIPKELQGQQGQQGQSQHAAPPPAPWTFQWSW